MHLKQKVIAGLVLLAALACTGAPTPTPTSPPPSPGTSAFPPIPSVLPTPAPTAVVAEDLTEVAFEYLQDLAEGLGPRESATGEELEAAEFLASQFAGLGYLVELQPFPVERLSREDSGLSVHRDNPGTEEIEVLPLSGSAFGEVSGALVPVGLGREQDIPPEGLAGRIALIERGEITFQRKARNAADAGARGVVISNSGGGNFRGDLGYSAGFPVASISWSDGQRLRELALDGEIDATLSLKLLETPSRNVIAEIPGDAEKVVVIGAHYDTVRDIAGANDNASGTAAVLAMARALSGKDLPLTVRFIAFGSEELGLLGSRAYVESLSEQEQGRIAAMFNFDALGGGTRLGVLGDPDLTDIVVRQAQIQSIEVEVSPGLSGGSSDHASFASVGIPVVMFFGNDASRIHTPEDTLEFVNPELPGNAARLGLALVDALAASF